MPTPLDTVNAFRTLTSPGTADVDAALELMTDDMTFASPLATANGSAAYGDLMRKLVPSVVSTTVHRQFSDTDAVCSIVEAVIRTPSGLTVKVPMAELYRFRDGKIARRRLYYDPRELAGAIGAMLTPDGDPPGPQPSPTAPR